MKKILYIILDGVGDRPVLELNLRTPLEAAVTPMLDRLAQTGKTGIVYPAGKGIAPESDIAVISLLGYDVTTVYTGRGPLEAFAEGMVVNEGDVALRTNFAVVDDDGIIIKDRRVGRTLTNNEAYGLAQEVNTKVTLSSAIFDFKSTVGHRGVLIIRALRSRLSGWITNTDPAYDRNGIASVAKEQFESSVMQSQPMADYRDSEEAQEAARLLNEFSEKSHAVLQKCAINEKRLADGALPANFILARDAGDRLPVFTNVAERYGGMQFASLVEMPVEKGIALLTGMEVVSVPRRTGNPETDYAKWVNLVLQNYPHFDGLYIHLKGPDEPGHDGDYNQKKESIEAIDKYFFTPLLSRIDLNDVLIAVTADHATPCALRVHSDDPVPLVISGGGIAADGSLSFSEKATKLGSLGAIEGKTLLGTLITFARQ